MSPEFGTLLHRVDDPNADGLIWMTTSIDGGLTWSAAVNTASAATGVGGQPVVQPNGHVVVPILSGDATKMLALGSIDGGATWGAPVTISTISDHQVAGGLRTTSLPSVAVDAAGTVYVVWQDCRFRAGCSSNDMVLTTSSDGITWTTPARIPIDAVASTVDHFIPGLTVDPTTSGSGAHLALAYYFYTQTACTGETCSLNAGFISSPDGGSSWSTPTTLFGPMSLSWLPSTSSGTMVGDDVATTYVNGDAFPVFASAQAKTGALFRRGDLRHHKCDPGVAHGGGTRPSFSQRARPLETLRSSAEAIRRRR